MSGYLIDLFFSLNGRANRTEWQIGTAVVVAVALAGIVLFNDGSFDESINADPRIPTMAAVLWALLCLYAFTALSTKRLHDAGRRWWTAAGLAVAVLLLICGWSAGYFLALFSPQPDTFVFWALVAAAVPALLVCARGREVA